MVNLYIALAEKIHRHHHLFFILPLFHFIFCYHLQNIYLYFSLPLFHLPLFLYTQNIGLVRRAGEEKRIDSNNITCDKKT